LLFILYKSDFLKNNILLCEPNNNIMSIGVVVVFGACGALGSCIISKFKEANWVTVAIDLHKSVISKYSIEIKGGSKEDAIHVLQQLKEFNLGKADVVISVAGGFVMGNIKDESIFATLDKMNSFNLVSAVLASHVASHCLKEGGLFVLTGAYSALQPTPSLIAYGISKAGTHHLVASLASPESGMPKDSSTVAILPVILDTPMNRKDMPNANFDDWTPLDSVGQLLLDWSSGNGKPKNGAMVKISTHNKKTEFITIN